MATRSVNAGKVAPEAVAAYKAASALYDGDADQREYLDACQRLHRALGRRPWQEDVMHQLGDSPPTWMSADMTAEWHRDRELLDELERAAASA